MKPEFEEVVKIMVNTSDGNHYWVIPTRKGYENLIQAEIEGTVSLQFLTKQDIKEWEQSTNLNYDKWRRGLSGQEN